MRRPFRLSIRTKLIFLLTSTASVSVLMACATFWIYQLVHYRSALRTEETALVQLIAESSAPALLFYDGVAANETLAALRADPRIETACLYDRRGGVVARLDSGRKVEPCPPASPEEMVFTRRHLLIFRCIKMKGEPVGSLYLQVSLTEMYGLLLHFGETSIYVLLITSFFAFLLSSFLQGIISGPILHLTRVATQVSDEGDYLLRAHPFSDDETGVLIGRFNSMMDRIQQREADLQQAHSGLEETVRLRTLDLLSEIAERRQIEADLVAAKLLAEESNRAKSTFLANMSHELRTPLNAIIGYSEMLYEDAAASGDAAVRDDLSKVLFSARHLLMLISQVLDISKIEAGRMELELEPVLAGTLLQEILSTAEVLAKRNRNTLHREAETWDGLVRVDVLRFRQCLLNLVSNSCKFTEDGHIFISVARRRIDGRDWVVWSVRDTGAGIRADAIGKLFQTFSQVDSSATRKHGGSGLGLAISQQLCHAMGGYITVESEFGVGSTFAIHIPQYVPGLRSSSGLSLAAALASETSPK